MLELRRQKQIEALRGTLVYGASSTSELNGISQCHLKRDLIAEDHEGGGSVIEEMKFGRSLFGHGSQLRLVFLVQTIGVRGRQMWSCRRRISGRGRKGGGV